MCASRVKIELRRQHVLLFTSLAFYGLMLPIDSSLCPLTVAVATGETVLVLTEKTLASWVGRRDARIIVKRARSDRFINLLAPCSQSRAIKMRENKSDAFIAITSRRSSFISPMIVICTLAGSWFTDSRYRVRSLRDESPYSTINWKKETRSIVMATLIFRYAGHLLSRSQWTPEVGGVKEGREKCCSRSQQRGRRLAL